MAPYNSSKSDRDFLQNKGSYLQINKALNPSAFESYLDFQLAGLPEIKDVEQISPRVIRVLGQNAGKFTLQGTNTYIVGTGRKRLLIDSGQGIPKWIKLISSTLSAHNVSLSHTLLTHWHDDHTGGIPDLIRVYPYMSNSIYKHTPCRTQRPIVDGQVFCVEGATIRAVHTPGHSHDHLCFILEEENAMFTGDNVLGHGTAAVEQLDTWMKSLSVMQMQNCKIGYPAHGEVLRNLPRKISSELASKTRREKQILQALRHMKESAGRGKGSATVQQLVTEIHGDRLDGAVRELAVQPFMEEVLRKLAGDGTVAFEVRSGQRKWFEI